MAGDPWFNKVVLLAGNNNPASGTTTFLDQSLSNKTITRFGSTVYGNATAPTGMTSAILFNPATSDFIDVANSTDWQFGTGDFCVELEFKTDSAGTYAVIGTANGTFDEFTVFFIAGVIKISASNDGATWNILNGASAGTFTGGVWNHFAFYRTGGRFYGAINGTVTNLAASATMLNTAAAMFIGANSGNFFNGWMSNIRIYKGYTPYGSSNFTVPTLPLPSSGLVLSPTALTTSSPVFGSVNVVSPVAMPLVAGVPIEGTPAPGFNFAAANLTTGPPVESLTSESTRTARAYFGSRYWGSSYFGHWYWSSPSWAPPLAVSAPVLAAPAIGQVLSAASLTVGAPAISVLAMTEALPPVGEADESPIIGAPAFGQVHVLAATSLAAGSPALDAPAMATFGRMTGVDLVVGSPALGTPAFGQVHILAATSLSAGSPSLSAPATGQVLSAVALTVTAPQFDAAVMVVALGQPYYGPRYWGQHFFGPHYWDTTGGATAGRLSASSLRAGSPLLGAPALARIPNLTAVDLVVSSPALGKGHPMGELSAEDISVGGPVLGTPLATGAYARPYFGPAYFGQQYFSQRYWDTRGGSIGPGFLLASSLRDSSPLLGVGHLGQAHGLIASSVTVGPPAFFRPVLTGPLPPYFAATYFGPYFWGKLYWGTRGYAFAPRVQTAAPVLGAAVIRQVQRLSTPGLTVGSPTISLPNQWQLGGPRLTTGSPVIGFPLMTPVGELFAVDLHVRSPSLPRPDLRKPVQVKMYTPNLVVGSPTIEVGTSRTALDQPVMYGSSYWGRYFGRRYWTTSVSLLLGTADIYFKWDEQIEDDGSLTQQWIFSNTNDEMGMHVNGSTLVGRGGRIRGRIAGMSVREPLELFDGKLGLLSSATARLAALQAEIDELNHILDER